MTLTTQSLLLRLWTLHHAPARLTAGRRQAERDTLVHSLINARTGHVATPRELELEGLITILRLTLPAAPAGMSYLQRLADHYQHSHYVPARARAIYRWQQRLARGAR